MTIPFNPAQGLVVVAAELTGPQGSAVLRPALDTGATSTLINSASWRWATTPPWTCIESRTAIWERAGGAGYNEVGYQEEEGTVQGIRTRGRTRRPDADICMRSPLERGAGS